MFVVETGVPMPASKPKPIISEGRYMKYPFKSMKRGDSFLAPAEFAERARDAAKHWRSRHPGWDHFYKMQKDGGVRIWRVA